MNNLDYYEFKLELFNRDNFQCQREGCTKCGIDNIELAHRISKGKCGCLYVQRYLRERHGKEYTLKQVEEKYIHHPFNIVTSCKEHNDSWNCLNNPCEANKIIDSILYE